VNEFLSSSVFHVKEGYLSLPKAHLAELQEVLEQAAQARQSPGPFVAGWDLEHLLMHSWGIEVSTHRSNGALTALRFSSDTTMQTFDTFLTLIAQFIDPTTHSYFDVVWESEDGDRAFCYHFEQGKPLKEEYITTRIPTPLEWVPAQYSTQTEREPSSEQESKPSKNEKRPLDLLITGKRPPVIAPKPHMLRAEEEEDDDLRVEMIAETEQEQLFLDALAGLVNQHLPMSRVPRGQSLRPAPPVTPLMTLDSFEGAYKGLIEVSIGRGKKARTEMEIIAVQKAIYESELAIQGQAVKQPSYWLSRYNGMTVYFPGRSQEIEVAWLLGDYDPAFTGIPAGTDPTPEQIANYLMEGVDDEEWAVKVIKRHLRTPEQKAWMDEQDISVEDLFHGRYPGNLDVKGILYHDWNTRLGVKVFGF